MADDSATALGVLPSKSDISNLAFANEPTGYYFFKFDQDGGGGINAVHIASASTDFPNYGQVTTTTSQSGTFYITDTGGRGYQDDAILLVAIKGSIPDNFAIHIKSSGYSWTPSGVNNQQPSISQITYHSGAVDSTFTKSQFVYGSQTWKPAGNNQPSDYPLYYGEDTTDTTNMFKLMFVDLKAGPLGSNGASINASTVSTFPDKGAVRVDYTITNLDTVATFNVYCWNDATTQGKGISWSNGLTSGGGVPSAVSGYTVLGPAYADQASEFPTAPGSTPVYHAPDTNFAANATSGPAPLGVQFNDTTPQSVKSWFWDFGDGSSSTSQNPTHTYQAPGTYTVTLTATNGQGINGTKSQPGFITVTSLGGTSSGGSSSGGDYGGDNGYGGTINGTISNHKINPVSFIANVTSGAPPLTVGFNDTSVIRNASTWAWDFNGDNIPDSTDQNATFTFSRVGKYAVNLTVNTTEGKVYSLTVPGFIVVSESLGASGDTWVSSDQYDPAPDPASGSCQGVSAAMAHAPAIEPTTPASGGHSPFGTKVAETLLDTLIVVGVIGVGAALWKKM